MRANPQFAAAISRRSVFAAAEDIRSGGCDDARRRSPRTRIGDEQPAGELGRIADLDPVLDLLQRDPGKAPRELLIQARIASHRRQHDSVGDRSIARVDLVRFV